MPCCGQTRPAQRPARLPGLNGTRLRSGRAGGESVPVARIRRAWSFPDLPVGCSPDPIRSGATTLAPRRPALPYAELPMPKSLNVPFTDFNLTEQPLALLLCS